jgi:hypothetical protein
VPKKQKTNIRWDLSRGGTGLLFPRGIEPEPWPEWLSKTFVNVHLVQEDPNALREELFDGRNAWGPVETLLYAIEQEAKKVLQENENEENAAAALKSIAAIRSKFFFLRQNGYLVSKRRRGPNNGKNAVGDDPIDCCFNTRGALGKHLAVY